MNLRGKDLAQKPTSHKIPWFGIGMASIFALSAALRFWGLNRFNTLVFDEIYYTTFASNYLTQTPFFDGHPPLSKYIIAFGIWLGSQFPQGETVNSMSGTLVAPWAYRWLNALLGSLIPLLVGGIAYRLSYRRSFALIAALLAALDGLLLVESRFALNNVHLVVFGLLGQWAVLVALARQSIRRWLWLAIAGAGFGAAAAIKWNGLWFLLGIYWLWLAAQALHRLQAWRRRIFGPLRDRWGRPWVPAFVPLQNLVQLKLLHILVFLAVVPFAVYALLWIPHLQLNPGDGFWQLQYRILTYHQNVGGNTRDVHPYCSPWYTWPLMVRSVAYFYQRVRVPGEAVPSLPPLPDNATRFIYDVHAMGNPLLWWLSTLAVACLLGMLIQRLWRGLAQLMRSRQNLRRNRENRSLRRTRAFPLTPTPLLWTALFLGLNYLANWLPWTRVTRCTFLYHYIGASIFASMTLAWFVDRGLRSRHLWQRQSAIAVLLLVGLAFCFWLPIYLGLPISPDGLRLRMWLQSWI